MLPVLIQKNFIFIRRTLVAAFFTVLILLLSSYFIHRTNGNMLSLVSEGQNQEVMNQYFGQPVRLIIPVINVDASIQQLGVTPNGDMEDPSNAVDVGWLKSGSLPGEVGSAVIAGHFDGKNGEIGVFADLYKLKAGDIVHIIDSNKTDTVFEVRESRIFDPGYADDVFSRNDKAHLNLVTCDGVWDVDSKSYDKRLVVFTDMMNERPEGR